MEIHRREPMRRFVCRRISIAVMLAAALAGCAGLGKPLQAPEIRLSGLRIEKIDWFETVLELQLRVFNTNDVPLELKALECTLELNGEPLARGLTSNPVRLEALSTDIVSMTVYSSAMDMAASFYRIVQPERRKAADREISYRLKGKLHLGGGALIPPSLRFDTSGELPLGKLLQGRGTEIRLDH